MVEEQSFEAIYILIPWRKQEIKIAARVTESDTLWHCGIKVRWAKYFLKKAMLGNIPKEFGCD
jgi:hypothetical protein